VLLVDDDPGILQWFRRALERRVTLTTACGPKEGLEVFDRDGPFAVVISDMRMPGMDGVEFLSAIRDRDPNTVRIMLTGHPDVETAIDAVNRGSIFRFLSKTSEPEELLIAIRAALDHRRLLQSRANLLEARLRAAQRMELVGRSAACVFHDIKNMLTVITLEAEMGMLQCEENPRAREHFERINRAAGDVARIAQQLVAVGRPVEREQLAPLCMDAFLHEFYGMLRTAIPKTIVIDCDVPHELPVIRADAGLLGQALLNLAINARDAMPEGGKLEIAVSVVTVSDDEARERGGEAGGDYLCIRVSDTGVGLERAQLARIFDPFFTTKRQGNGLGLSLVIDVARRHHGWVAVSSEPGEGTSFFVYIPACNQQNATEPKTTMAEVECDRS